MKNPRRRLGRYLTLAAVGVAIVAQALAMAVPAHAEGMQSPAYFDRNQVIQRAKTWTNAGVPYDQGGWLHNYRTDCSGFVSMAWGLDRSYVTWSLPEVARPISKADLQPGDILLNTQRHVVMFGGWANSQHTAYRDYEEVGHPWSRAISRVVAYPYDTPTASDYHPYRYAGGHSLNSPGSTLPNAFMATYAGSGQVTAPSPQAAQLNARIQAVALQRGRQLAKQQAQAAAKAQAEAKAKAEAKALADAKAAAAKTAAHQRHLRVLAAAAQTREAAQTPAAAQLFGGLVSWLSH